jgi:alpha-D-xyloside xylohydrolase
MNERQIIGMMRTALFLLFSVSAVGQWVAPNPVKDVRKEQDGLTLTMARGTTRVRVCSDSIVRVTYSPTASFPNRPDYVVIKTAWPAVQWGTEANAQEVVISTAWLKVSINRKDGVIAYADAAGKHLISEGPKIMTPATANGEAAYRAEDVFPIYGSMEALYGLGQHQAGVWNYRGASVDLSQENTEIAIPLLVSSNGYGLFWNNDSRSRVNNRFVHTLYISSEVAEVIDYYFIYGPELDKIVAAYRELTGAAPMFGKWAYGFWQCKNKYQSQDELLGVAKKYRDLHIPVDNIVQDWFWWNHKGEHVFNSKYPDPQGMIAELHREHYHLMISVWPFFDPGTAVYAQMDKLGYFIDRTKTGGFHPQGMAVYDATNPDARTYYWKLMDDALFKIGADAWWLDTDEPETEGREENVLLDHKVSIGSGARYANLYPLMTTTAVHDGQRAESDQKRVFILSRSGFAGVQRNGVTAWSGDILSNWESFKRQIPAGLNFELSGVPYWTTDVGGFFIGNPDDPKYRELFVRWFEYGAFCPIFRVHGTRTTDQNELWSYGPEAQKILVAYDRLRYELMPYIYSLAWKTTHESYTPMRPLVMDFRTDVTAQNIGDQFLYGPSILVNPVTEAGATSRHLYLPKAEWFDFWTGKKASGGRWVDAEAGLDRMPLYVRAGSIVPMGPDVEYTAEKDADPVELRVYRGADADFTLYEDQGDTYAYEKGSYSTIAMHWDDAQGRLTIGNRLGNFPGMLPRRTFRVVFVSDGHGAGIGATDHPESSVIYSGEAITVPR